MAVAYHTHVFEIPTATGEETAAGVIDDKVVVPSGLAAALAGYQQIVAPLTSIAGLATGEDQMLYLTGEDTYATTALYTLGRSLLGESTAAGMRNVLELGSAALSSASDFATAEQGAKADTALQSIVGGIAAAVDNTDPLNPVINFTGSGTGDMQREVYDPREKEADVFDAANIDADWSNGEVADAPRMSVTERLRLDCYPTILYGADGQGGTNDRNALDALIADQVSQLPRLQRWANGTINVGNLIPGPDTEDPFPYIKKIIEAGLPAGKAFKFGREREWWFPTRPSGSPYITLSDGIYEMAPGARWDLTSWSLASAPQIMRAHATFADDVAVTADITKNDMTLTVGSGHGIVPGQWCKLYASSGLDDFSKGRWTAADGSLGELWQAKCQEVQVTAVTSTTISLSTPALFDLPVSTTAPKLRPYLTHPRLRFENFCVDMPIYDGGSSSDRLMNIQGAQDLIVNGGECNGPSGYAIIFSSIGGHIDGFRVRGSRQSGAGGGIAYQGGTLNFTIQNCLLENGSQLLMGGTTNGPTWPGQSDGVKIIGNHVRGGNDGLTQHNCERNTIYEKNLIEQNTGTCFDIRTPGTTLRNNRVKGTPTATGVFLRTHVNGYNSHDNIFEDLLSGLRLTTFGGNDSYEQTPGDITVVGDRYLNIGGIASAGAISMSYDLLEGGVVPTLGKLIIKDVVAEMTNNVAAIRIGGKWQDPEITNTSVIGSGTGRPFLFDGAGLGAGNGPINVRGQGNSQSASYIEPSILDSTGLHYWQGHTKIGATGAETRTLSGGGNIGFVYQGFYIIASNSGDTDNWDGLAAMAPGSRCTFVAASGHTITIRNGNGNIYSKSGSNITMSGSTPVTLVCDGTNWYEA